MSSRWAVGRIAVAAALLLAAAAWAWAALKVPPPPDHRINDYAGVLSPADRQRLEQKLIGREGTASNQVVVAIFKSLEGESLEDFSIRLAQAWRVGQKGLDNGVIFLIFVDDHKMRLEVGYGLEANLTDAISSSILRDVVAPRFREGRMADGIAAGLDAIDQAIAGTYKRPASSARPAQGPNIASLLILLFVLGGLGMSIIPPLFFYRSRGQGWTGGRSGWGGPSGGIWIGGGGGGGGGFGDGGGFSGGGGSFGGGGASGSW